MPLHWDRWILPFYISPILLASFGASSLIDLINSFKKSLYSYLTKGFIVICVLNMLFISCSITYDFTLPNTINESIKKLHENSIDISELSGDCYSPIAPIGCPLKMEPTTYDDFTKGSGKYLVTSGWCYNRFYAEPKKYYNQLIMYEKIKTQNNLLFEIRPKHFFAESDFSPIEIVNFKHFIIQTKNAFCGDKFTRGTMISIYKKL